MSDSALLEFDSHRVQRITARTGVSFDEFVAAFEAAVPPRDLTEHGTLAASDRAPAPTSDDIDEAAPNSFRVFTATGETDPASPRTGGPRAISWLFGNREIAGHVFGNDPRAILYAPLRIAAFENGDGQASVTFERPSDAFRSLTQPEIAAVGDRLDHKLADLLDALGVAAAADQLRTPAHRPTPQPNTTVSRALSAV